MREIGKLNSLTIKADKIDTAGCLAGLAGIPSSERPVVALSMYWEITCNNLFLTDRKSFTIISCNGNAETSVIQS